MDRRINNTRMSQHRTMLLRTEMKQMSLDGDSDWETQPPQLPCLCVSSHDLNWGRYLPSHSALDSTEHTARWQQRGRIR